jgi:crotonobetainyl-CoA:carnitine CoA-transferase CaiB-like acyl-CoA transferase
MAAPPVAGLVVIELGHSIAAPYAGLVLAGLGAEVIKVEPASKSICATPPRSPRCKNSSSNAPMWSSKT